MTQKSISYFRLSRASSLEGSIKFNWVRFGNTMQSNSHTNFWCDIITLLNSNDHTRSIKFDQVCPKTVRAIQPIRDRSPFFALVLPCSRRSYALQVYGASELRLDLNVIRNVLNRCQKGKFISKQICIRNVLYKTFV